MTDITTKAGVKRASIEITVTRADGTVEHYGEVSRYHPNRIVNRLWHIQDRLRVRRLRSRYESRRREHG